MQNACAWHAVLFDCRWSASPLSKHKRRQCNFSRKFSGCKRKRQRHRQSWPTARCMHHTECCAQASPPLLTQRTGCKAQLATAAQDAAGSAELQQEVNRLKSESAQAGPIEGPKSRAVNRNPKACSGTGTPSSRREAAAGSRETHS